MSEDVPHRPHAVLGLLRVYVRDVSAAPAVEEVASVPAGRPALFYMEEPGTLSINVSNVQVVPTSDDNKWDSGVSSWYMNGTYKGVSGLVSGTDKNVYFVANNQFWFAEAPISMSPFRAWFETSSTLSAAKLRIAIEGEAEGIQSIEEDKEHGEIIFDLMGRQTDSSRKGIVIRNGKVVFIK